MTDRTTTKLGTPNGKRLRESSVTADERQVRANGGTGPDDRAAV